MSMKPLSVSVFIEMTLRTLTKRMNHNYFQTFKQLVVRSKCRINGQIKKRTNRESRFTWSLTLRKKQKSVVTLSNNKINILHNNNKVRNK